MSHQVTFFFDNLTISEEAVKRVFRKQVALGRKFSTFMLITLIYAILLEIGNREQNRQIEELRKEIKKLKRSEGE